MLQEQQTQPGRRPENRDDPCCYSHSSRVPGGEQERYSERMVYVKPSETERQYKNISLAEMPEILTAKHISAHLHLSLRRVYELFKLSPIAGGIKSFTVGRSQRAEKKDYIEWLDVTQGKKQ